MKAMNVLGLNGLTVWPFFSGRISQHFREGCFPYRWNWRPRDLHSVLRAAQDAFSGSDYVVIGFSDGATLAHFVAQRDPACVGVIAHSGLFEPVDIRRKPPVLLLRTQGDAFRSVFRQTDQMRQFYRLAGWTEGFDLQMSTLEPTKWHAHEFANGLGTMQDWVRKQFGCELPVA